MRSGYRPINTQYHNLRNRFRDGGLFITGNSPHIRCASPRLRKKPKVLQIFPRVRLSPETLIDC